MTGVSVPFASGPYWMLLALLVVARSADFLSTWIATPNLVLEANPVARFLGWRGGILVNTVVCAVSAMWPIPAIMLVTTSCLVAARNFQSAWIMKTLGEAQYRAWFAMQLIQAPKGLFFACTAAQVLLMAGLGTLLVFFSHEHVVPLAVGLGMITFALAVLLFTTLAVWPRVRSRNIWD